MFQTAPASEKKFSDLNELLEWVADEKKFTSRVPINVFLENGAKFQEDQYFGNSDFKLIFTEEGLKALCYKLGFPPIALEKTEESGLASRILNDLFSQDNLKAQLFNSEFVIDEKDKGNSQGKVCGVVSSSYVGYSNESFIQDIFNVIGLNNPSPRADLKLIEAYSINTRLHIRFTNEHIFGTVSGIGGKTEDKTEIGLEFGNSMVGDAAVSINYFLNRLVCANGLVLPAGQNGARIIHSGKAESFLSRLNRVFDDVFSGLGEKAMYVKELGAINFSPQRLAELDLSKMIFDIIPASKSTVIENYKSAFSRFIYRKLSPEDKLSREALAIEYLPRCYAGKLSGTVFNSMYRDNQTMFDFINVFTEYANRKPPSEKIEIQKRTGQLADWVIKNKKMFN